MISKIEYDLLIHFLKQPELDDELLFFEEIERLKKDRFIRYNIIYDNMYNGYLVTPLGQRAIEEYEAFQTNESREDQTLEISKKSDKKSTISLWIASISALISLGSLIIAILKQ